MVCSGQNADCVVTGQWLIKVMVPRRLSKVQESSLSGEHSAAAPQNPTSSQLSHAQLKRLRVLNSYISLEC